ncbi:hypothetical protein Scep_016119 [Stephania cephalantha]|uniref:Isopenicillin N synthase-like Fe(2+) 2OG dioxygenase domain-containing protein n=1 Tax=Stephania cephalantha TaxID=152367 RepID=A0AAP0ILZ8_9MAGN
MEAEPGPGGDGGVSPPAIESTGAKNLGLEAEKLTDHFKDGTQGMRMNYYPPCPQADKVLGISAHSDANGLTLLLQVNQVQELQLNQECS